MLIMRLHQAVKEIQLKTQFYLKNDELTLFRINALHWVKKSVSTFLKLKKIKIN